MKCMFNPEIQCAVYDVLKEATASPNPYKILEHACPMCENRPFPGGPFPERPHPKRPKRPGK